MKLYYAPGACSLSPHIVAHEAGLKLALEKVDLGSKKTETGRDFTAINPKGYVPALELDDGELLTEGPAIVQWLADQRPSSGLMPPTGTMDRYRVQSMLGYVNTELHKSFGPLFNPNTTADLRSEREGYLRKRYVLVEQQLDGNQYLFGHRFTVADAYLFTITQWARFVKLDLGGFPNLAQFQQRVADRPGVQAALRAEGLLQ